MCLSNQLKHVSGVVLALTLVSCHTIRYSAEPTPLITTAAVEGTVGTIHYSQKAHLFLWGFVPNPYEVNLTAVAVASDAPEGLASVHIHEEWSFLDSIVQLFTIGIYAPRSIVITGDKIQ
jgi:hypothetical protein